jgi:hypothetical protein
MKHNSGKWLVRPDYGKENVYRLWNADSNYHEDTSPEVMDGNACLMQSAPRLLKALCVLVDHAQEQYPHFESERGQQDIRRALEAIQWAKGKV